MFKQSVVTTSAYMEFRSKTLQRHVLQRFRPHSQTGILALFCYVHSLVNVWVVFYLLVIIWPQSFIWKSRLVLKAHFLSLSSHRWTVWGHFHIKSTSTSQRRLILFEMNMLRIVLIRHAPLFFFSFFFLSKVLPSDN